MKMTDELEKKIKKTNCVATNAKNRKIKIGFVTNVEKMN